MSKAKQKNGAAVSGEPGLFDMTDGEPGTLDQLSLVKAAMSESIHRSPYKRLEIAFRLSTFLGYIVTEDLLNQMTSSKPEYQLKVGQLNAFCRAVGNLIVYERLLESEGRRVLDPKDAPALKLAAAIRKRRDAEREIHEAEGAL